MSSIKGLARSGSLHLAQFCSMLVSAQCLLQCCSALSSARCRAVAWPHLGPVRVVAGAIEHRIELWLVFPFHGRHLLGVLHESCDGLDVQGAVHEVACRPTLLAHHQKHGKHKDFSVRMAANGFGNIWSQSGAMRSSSSEVSAHTVKPSESFAN